MGDSLIVNLERERTQKRSLIDNLTQAAADEGRDLTEQDVTSITAATERVRSLNSQIDLVSTDLELAGETADRLSRIANVAIAGDFHYRSDGQLLWDVMHQSDADARTRYGRVQRRAAEHMGTLAANTTPVAGDLGGLVVKPVVGPVIAPFPTGMPLANAIGMRDVPATDGFGFSRPQIVDDGFESGMAVQTLEKAELASKAFKVTTTPVALRTVGGYLNISQQLLAFNSTALDIILAQLRRRLEWHIDEAMLAELDNSTGGVDLPADADSATILAAIYTAAAQYYTITKTLPTTLAMGPLGWARLGSLVDLAGRPLFPTLGAANAIGTAQADAFIGSVAGLRPVVTPAITDATFWVFGPDAIEGYIYRFPVLEAVEPSVLGRQVAVAASIAGFRPTPFANAAQHLAPA